MDFIKRGKGVVLLHEGYEYTKHTVYKNNNTLWKCNKRHKTKCRGSIIVSPEKQINNTVSHSTNCVPDEIQCTIEFCMNKCFDEAAQGKITVPKAYNNAIISLKDQGIHLLDKPLPKYSEKKSSLYRHRNKVLNVSRVCSKRVQDVEVPLPFRNFLLADYNQDEERILIFCRQAVRDLLKNGNYFVDGTFSACPVPFKQLLTIHFDFGSDMTETKVVPVIYVLLSNKSYKTYTILLDMLKTTIPDWNPTKVNLDFERALIKAFQKEFPAAVINGCYFHFVKSLTKKGKSIGMNKSINLKIILQLTCRLPLLPENRIEEGWNYILTEMGGTEAEKRFKKYMENYWLKNNFSRVWCVFGERHRTNNTVEAWNRKLNRLVPVNGNIVQLLHILYEDTVMNEEYSKQREILQTKKDMMILEEQLKLINGTISIGKTSINLDEEQGQKLSWKSYPSWEVIRKYLIYIAKENKEIAELKTIGESACSRPIMMLKISNNAPENKPMLIISGVHGQEWVGVITVVFVLNSLASKYTSLPKFLQNIDWYFIPVLNPDGYHHTHHIDRFWRKNRRKVDNGIGVDLAYNFGKYWGKDEDFLNNCAPSYEGPCAFSEPETKALRDFVEEQMKIKPFEVFIDIQSYGQIIQYPWNAVPDATKDSLTQINVAHMMRQMIYNRTQTSFQFTSGYDVPYPRHGVSIDWAYSLGIIYSYIIKTRDTGEHGFLLPNKLMKDTAAEVLRAIKYLAVVLDDSP